MAVQPLIMPKLGAYNEDVLLTEWLVAEGEEVAAGTAVFELETDKTTAEVEAEASGWLHRLVAVGETVPIGTRVGVIAETEAEYEALAREAAAVGGATAAADNSIVGYIDQGAGAAATGSDTAAAGEPPGSSSKVPTVPAPTSTGAGRELPLISPRARALLKKLGFSIEDAREIPPSGPGGRIVDRDVVAWAEAQSIAPAAAPGDAPPEPTVQSTIPLRGRRGTIATRMVASLQAAAQLTSVLEIDVAPLVELRARLNQEGATPRVGVTSIVVKLVAAALREHPLLNARVTETDVELLGEINIAVAVDTPQGLLAPVVAGADELSLEAINGRIVDLASRAQDGSLAPADVAGGTFTVSNGGIHPVDITTAILNPPQTGILWIGRIRDRPFVVGEGTIAVRPTLQACLTFDHRAIDGGPAAAFLATFERLVADLPELPS